MSTESVGCSADITERKRGEEALRESEEKFREFAENADQVFWITDPKNLQMIYVSPAYERIWGRSGQSLCSSPSSWAEAIHPEDRQRVLQAVDAKAKTGVDYELEYRIARPDGEMRWISDRSFPIRSTAGSIYRVGGIARDITLRKQMEEELAAHRAQLEEAQSLAQLGRWNWDIPTNTLTWSDELYRIFELRREEISATREAFLEFLHPQDRPSFEAVHQGALNGDRLYDFEVKIVRSDRSVRILHTRARVVFDPISQKPRRMFGTAQDITERKQTEEALRQANERVQVLSRRLFQTQEEERRHLARELHDQMGQTLTAAKIDLLAAQRLEERNEIVQRLDGSIAVVERLLEQVRHLSLELRPPLLDDLGLVPALRWYLDQQAQRASFRVEFFADPTLERVEVDIETACFRVVQESLANVVRHARAKKVSVQLRRAPQDLHLVVRDDGIGFDVEIVRLGASLGLLGIRERVALIGGEFDCKSVRGGGTEVHAFFPTRSRLGPEEPSL